MTSYSRCHTMSSYPRRHSMMSSLIHDLINTEKHPSISSTTSVQHSVINCFILWQVPDERSMQIFLSIVSTVCFLHLVKFCFFLISCTTWESYKNGKDPRRKSMIFLQCCVNLDASLIYLYYHVLRYLQIIQIVVVNTRFEDEKDKKKYSIDSRTCRIAKMRCCISLKIVARNHSVKLIHFHSNILQDSSHKLLAVANGCRNRKINMSC